MHTVAQLFAEFERREDERKALGVWVYNRAMLAAMRAKLTSGRVS